MSCLVATTDEWSVEAGCDRGSTYFDGIVFVKLNSKDYEIREGAAERSSTPLWGFPNTISHRRSFALMAFDDPVHDELTPPLYDLSSRISSSGPAPEPFGQVEGMVLGCVSIGNWGRQTSE
jgi:hypothetical protein